MLKSRQVTRAMDACSLSGGGGEDKKRFGELLVHRGINYSPCVGRIKDIFGFTDFQLLNPRTCANAVTLQREAKISN